MNGVFSGHFFDISQKNIKKFLISVKSRDILVEQNAREPIRTRCADGLIHRLSFKEKTFAEV